MCKREGLRFAKALIGYSSKGYEFTIVISGALAMPYNENNISRTVTRRRLCLESC